VSNLLPEFRESFMSYQGLKRFLNYYSINFYLSNVLYLLYDQVKIFPTGGCVFFDKKIFLSTRHNLYPCEKISAKYAIGKVNEKVILDIPAIVQKHNFYYEQFKKVCQNCYTSRSCSICLWKIENLDNLDMEELVCPGFQNLEAYKDKLYRLLSLLEKHPDDLLKMINTVIHND